MTQVVPLRNKVAFQFVEEVGNSKFTQKTESGIIIAQIKEHQVNKARWGKVLSVGPEVPEGELDSGDFIFIDSLRWTNALEVDDNKVWLTTFDDISLVSKEVPQTF